MKKFFLAILFVIIVSGVSAQNKDQILGRWLSEHGSGQIEIYKTGDRYFGKLVSLKEPDDPAGNPKKDIHNPNEKLRSGPVLGMVILKDFVYNKDNEWANGTVYNPKTGKTYSCKMNLLSNDKLNIKGYVGISMLGKSEVWSRVK